MSYATNADLEQRIGPKLYVQLTDDSGSGAADEQKVAAALAEAEAEVNASLAVRYQVPVDVAAEPQVAALLRSVTLDLAEYRLHARRPAVPGDVASRCAAARGWLARVADGRAVLPSAGELPPSNCDGPRGVVTGSARVWGRDDADGL